MHASRFLPNMAPNTRWMDGFVQVAMALALLNFAAKNVNQPGGLQYGVPFVQQGVNYFPSRNEKPTTAADTLLDQLLSLNGAFDRREVQPNHAMYAMPTTFSGPMPFHRQASCDSDELSLLSAGDSNGPTNAFYHRADGSSPFHSAPSPFSSASSSGAQDLTGSDDLSAYSPRFTLNDFDLDLLDLPKEEEQDHGLVHDFSLDNTAKKQSSLPDFDDFASLEMALSSLQGGAPEVKGTSCDSQNGFHDLSGFQLDLPSSGSSTASRDSDRLLPADDGFVYFDGNGLPIFAGQDHITADDISDLLASSFPEDSKSNFQELSSSLSEDKNSPLQNDKLLLPHAVDFDLSWDNNDGKELSDPCTKGPESVKSGKFLNGLSETEVTDMPVEKFNAWIKALDTADIEFAKDLRRKGKNKMAARNCRKRKFDAIGDLDSDITEMKKRQAELLEERQRLLAETQDAHKSTQWLHDYIFENLRDEQGQQFPKEHFTLQYSSDGNVYLVPNHLTVKTGLSSEASSSSDPGSESRQQ